MRNFVKFWYVLIAHILIQVIDGNVVVPILFSDAVNLHPLAILIAILFFGTIWGIWGVFCYTISCTTKYIIKYLAEERTVP